MKRREFLISAAAAVAAGFARTGWSQSVSRPDPAKLARIAIMTLDFGSILKLPGQPANPARTLEVFDIPQMYADTYGVHNIEFQHSHIVSTEPSYLKELRAQVDRTQSRITNINLEFGGMNISSADPVQRIQAIDLTKRWVDHAVILGCPRVMINQGQPTDENKAWGIPTLKTMGDYARSRGVMLSVETRGNGGGGRGAGRGTAPAAPPGATPPSTGSAQGPAAAPTTRPTLTVVPAWVLLAQLIKDSGTYSNVDLGNVAAADQGELHVALRTLLPMTVGNIHTRVSQVWDLATALKFMTRDLGYSGLFSIEVNNGHEGIRPIYDIVLANI